MRKILFAYPEVSPLFPNGGIGTYVYEVSRILASTSDWHVDILVDRSYYPQLTNEDFNSARKMFKKNGINLYDLTLKNKFIPGWNSHSVTRAEKYYYKILELTKSQNYDIIEFPDWRATCFFVIRHKMTLGGFENTKMVIHLHSSTQDVLKWLNLDLLSRDDMYSNYMEEYSKKYSDVIISPSCFMLEPIYKNIKYDPSNKLIIRNGYPMSDSIKRFMKNNERSRTDINIACISRLETRKGQHILAQSIKSLYENNKIKPNVHFYFCGKDGVGIERDGSMSKTLKRILKGIPNWSIINTKSRDELIGWLSKEIDICIVPSNGDNYPNVVIESALAGCYLIVSNAGGIPEIMDDYKITGSIFDKNDSMMLASEIENAIYKVENGLDKEKMAYEFEEGRKNVINSTIETYNSIYNYNPKPYISRENDSVEPLVSVIIPFYNAHKYAHESINSAYNSNYSNFEVILVNDGSDDKASLEFLDNIKKQFPDLKIINKENGGLGDARNMGIKNASGQFIVPLDADNLLMPDMLSKCSKVLSKRYNLSYVTTYYQCLKENDRTKIPWQRSPISKPLGTVNPLFMLENTVGDALSMIKKSAIEEAAYYSPEIYCFEDWDLWLRFYELNLEGDVIPEILFIYRLSENGMHRSLDAFKGLELHQKLLRKHEKLMREQSLGISTLLLSDYWQKWRITEEKGIEIADFLINFVKKNPLLPIKYVYSKLSNKIFN